MSEKLPSLHLACSNDSLRPALQYISIQDGIAYATDAHLIVVVNLKRHSPLADEVVDALDGKFIHAETWEKIHDADIITCEQNILIYQKGDVKARFEISEDIEFPEVHKVLTEAIQSPLSNTQRISFNPELIGVIAKIFGSKRAIKVQFRNEGRSIILFPNDVSKQYAVLVPLMEQAEMPFDFDFNIIN